MNKYTWISCDMVDISLSGPVGDDSPIYLCQTYNFLTIYQPQHAQDGAFSSTF